MDSPPRWLTATASRSCQQRPAADPRRHRRLPSHAFRFVGRLRRRHPVGGLPRLSPSADVRLWAKLEDRNPTGSVKDRAAIAMVEAAERTAPSGPVQPFSETHEWQHRDLAGDDRPDPRLPPVCAAGEHLARAFGIAADLRCRDHLHPDPAVPMRRSGWLKSTCRGEPRLGDALPVRQPGECGRPLRHHRSGVAGRPPTITHFVAGLGTTGTLMGAGRFLREHKPGIEIIAAEPRYGELVYGLQHRRRLRAGVVRPGCVDPPNLGECEMPFAVRENSSTSRDTRRRLDGRILHAALGIAQRAHEQGEVWTSPSSSAMADGSTCPPAPTSGTSMRPRPDWKARSGPDVPPGPGLTFPGRERGAQVIRLTAERHRSDRGQQPILVTWWIRRSAFSTLVWAA